MGPTCGSSGIGLDSAAASTAAPGPGRRASRSGNCRRQGPSSSGRSQRSWALAFGHRRSTNRPDQVVTESQDRRARLLIDASATGGRWGRSRRADPGWSGRGGSRRSRGRPAQGWSSTTAVAVASSRVQRRSSTCLHPNTHRTNASIRAGGTAAGVDGTAANPCPRRWVWLRGVRKAGNARERHLPGACPVGERSETGVDGGTGVGPARPRLLDRTREQPERIRAAVPARTATPNWPQS